MTDKNANTEICKEFCPNCEADTPCTHEAELYVCEFCGEDFAKYIVSRNCNVSDVSMTQDVLTDVKTGQSVEIEKLQIRLSEWRGVARQLADELKEEISSKCTVIWEEVGETSPAWIAYNNLVDTEDYETNPDYYNPDYQSPWISITSGRLPEKFQECIVLDKRRHVHNWIHDDALLPLFAQYTHWMPLPEPPEEEK